MVTNTLVAPIERGLFKIALFGLIAPPRAAEPSSDRRGKRTLACTARSMLGRLINTGQSLYCT
jgi:hypothetical protein